MTPPRPLIVVTALLSLVVLVNLWIFARFTVDDAFITWRYGQNLIAHGIWAYNPDGFDLTQAYTNPVFAALSILPAAMGWDMVLSFKLLSLLTLAGIGALLLREAGEKARMAFVLVLGLAIPASIAHAFSGLETWLYGGTLALFFIYAEQRKWTQALLCVLLLVLTRPEAWLLFALYPVMLLTTRPARAIALRHGAALGLMATGYFGFHLWYFGEALPNTYFIKSGDGFNPAQALRILPYVLPALAVQVWGNRRTGLGLLLYFGAVGYSYASSDLLMNYLQRFAFQIALPMALYLGWAVSRAPVGQARRGWLTLWVAVYLAAFGVHTRSLGDHLGIANYYPRLLDSHVALGRALNALSAQGAVASFALGDAGAAAYHADIRALDTIGLTSHLVARDGLTLAVVQAYAPDVVAFFATAEGVRDLPDRHAALWAYVAETGMTEQCELVWARQYTLRLFTRSPLPALSDACAHSAAANGTDELRYALRALRQPPWTYWHE
ncbi:hypothetical protein [Pararhodobacter zhoushanensis]|uniref:DUF2029 domain-containing protein n=1 Tax=Pararhodobacter zhoushanensis TaxID=2479545 RepID=A0ABT3H2I6_9RHOB|nr:hypothetical protein [Pararhodobacter zhoushanensis]MCW1404420.1 hypothetical protein [Novosphingobium sp. MW5]MCW1934009.1 hypothetical protein [Pararhodobacter zhoushanensis]